MLFRGMDQAALDAGYNNSLAVANSSDLLRDFEHRSQIVRQGQGATLNLRYGPAPRNCIDYFAADEPGPLLIFIHGGYWQMRAKENFSFVAKGPLAHGIHVALIGYTLAPDLSLTGIVEEIRLSIAWLKEHAREYGGDPNNMILSGWSAGGHLTAMCLDEPGITNGVAISGIYDLAPIQMSYLNRKLQLSEAEVALLSPFRLPQSQRPLILAYGTEELPELQRQSLQFGAARQACSGAVLPLKQHNHFTILHELASPQGKITREICGLARCSTL